MTKDLLKVNALQNEIDFIKTRTGSKDIVMIGDSVNQTLTLLNKSEYEISNIFVQDTISDGAKFVSNSVIIGGNPYAGLDPVAGFNVPNSIKAGNSETITYTIKIEDTTESKISLYSTVSYSANGNDYTENSNTYILEMPDKTVVIRKTSNKSAVIKGQVLTFQNIIENTGNLTHRQITFKDTLPEKTSFVEGSVKVNGTSKPDYNPEIGFTLSSLYAKEKIEVSFNVDVN